ncbi:hypothetical protein ILUMI_16102, partial [Ignelater luminosus]
MPTTVQLRRVQTKRVEVRQDASQVERKEVGLQALRNQFRYLTKVMRELER